MCPVTGWKQPAVNQAVARTRRAHLLAADSAPHFAAGWSWPWLRRWEARTWAGERHWGRIRGEARRACRNIHGRRGDTGRCLPAGQAGIEGQMG